MSHGIYSALSGALSQSVLLETTATNLANTSTAGYRALRPVFHEVLARQGGKDDAARFVAVRRTGIDTTPGAVRVTDRALDIALPKDAFLAVRRENGTEAYTRASSLELAPDGRLMTRSGHIVLSENQEVIQAAPSAEISISEKGEVSADGEAIAFLRIVSFNDPKQLTYEGATLLSGGNGTGEATQSDGTVQVGMIEASNATPVRAMSDLMMATRMFEAMGRAIDTFREIDHRLVTTVPKA